MKKFSRIFLAFLFCSFSILTEAQISHGGRPYSFLHEMSQLPASAQVQLPAIDLKKYEQADSVTDQYKDIPYRFGIKQPVDLNLNNSGTWTNLADGSRIWRLDIVSQGARTMNFCFDKYDIPDGASVFIYTPDHKAVLGSFTNKNNSGHNCLGVGFLPGDEIIIEYLEPASHVGEGKLHISYVTHGYRGLAGFVKHSGNRGAFGQSGACEINVNCPVGLPWQAEKNAVAMIVVNGNALCSGSLVNNTAQDETPYFLTANHCYQADQNVATWVFYFNYESSDCSGSDEVDNHSVSGSTHKANYGYSDFALLELNSSVPQSYNPYFAGWDHSDDSTAVTSAVGIHHPAGDIKKISFENDPLSFGHTFGGAAHEVWNVTQWDAGVTEGGSSGSPLFDQNHRIIGQLFGGGSACNGDQVNGLGDSYGRFGVSWDGGGTPDSRLKDWLDPQNTGVVSLPGYPQTTFNFDVMLDQISNPSSFPCGSSFTPSFRVYNNGSETLTSFHANLLIDNNIYSSTDISCNIPQYISDSLSLGSVNSLAPGTHTIKIVLSLPNGQPDQNPANDTLEKSIHIFSSYTTLTFHLTTDDYPDETSWKLKYNGEDVAISPSYSQPANDYEESICVGEGACYTFSMYDVYGDGICCSFGNGHYALLDAQNDTLASGSSFGHVDSTEFCLNGASGLKESPAAGISLFPNPTNGDVSLRSDQAISNKQLTIYNALGQIEYQTKLTIGKGEEIKLPTSGYTPGIYLIRVGENYTYRLLKE